MVRNLQRRRTAILVQALSLALLLPAVLAFDARAQAQFGGSLVGTWYGDLARTETINGRPANHRRWLRILRHDGTYTIIFRYYFNNLLQLESIEHGEWGHQGRLYWTHCRSAVRAGRPEPCTARWEYEIQRIDQREMAYTNRATGEFFIVTRVADGFRLP
jgi:hypothetical protein